ncbi:type III PLP-dependent enzyme [Alkalihalobacillus sp. AL-G]|uniref:type III PLP-dependent enzyme n=1 Tax=Alkalihalobacillus sp. AL-G TaxID=2926399 RepID=UPI00272C960C|nr:type III PLP-dependent enzyme [Alkalihalobacillus sp. AL-G]WLD92621.1 type III PLP-dependent enzyme [Alkalihalobacillus sp. AL-G]
MMLTIEDQEAAVNEFIDCLIEKRAEGDSFCAYIYNLKKLKDHAIRIKQSLPDFCYLFYAMKANPDIRILKVLDEIVDGFDAASAGEIQTAKTISIKPVIFGAPAKKEYEIKHIVHGDVQWTNVESFHDLKRLQYWGDKAGTTIPIIVRVNLKDDVSDSHLKMSGVPTQFGVDERHVPQLLRKLSVSPNLEFKGFHFHAMSNNLDAERHVNFIELCIKKAISWSREHRLSLSVVNVGGGVGINYFNADAPFEWDILSQGLHTLQKRYGAEGFKLILELGRYMVADCGYYTAEVIDIKENHGEQFALLRGGSHHFRLPAAWKMSHPFFVHPVAKWDYPFERPMISNSYVTITGELCTPNDVLAKHEYVNELKVGDLIIFMFTGAYGWSISHRDFLSHPYPEVHYID